MRPIIPGKIGGKARGLLYAAMLLEFQKLSLADDCTALLEIPPSFLLGTELFERLMESNRLEEVVRHGDEFEIRNAFLNAELSADHRESLQDLLSHATYPLAVRSSSVLEDNLLYSFAGIYLTLFLSNRGTPSSRLAQLEAAVKLVLASTYNVNAAAYRRKHRLKLRDEKMAVLVQRMVGQRHGELFYPLFAGVAFSKNFYPWTDRLRRDDGVVRLVFGLGTRAVGRNYARLFSLSDPRLRPEGSSVRDILKYSQEIFDALDMPSESLVSLSVREALQDPDNELHKICSILKEDGYFMETPFPLAPRDRFVLTFDPVILSDRYIPFVSAVRSLLRNLEREYALPVDIEFAVNLLHGAAGHPSGKFSLLQVRPMGVREEHRKVSLEAVDRDRILIESHMAMGNGILDAVEDIVFVAPERYHSEHPEEVARQVARLNDMLAGKNYILIGPGRWGSVNPQLGVPVSYADISNASVIVEVAGGRFAPELSYGTHFFGDLLADGTLFLSVILERGDTFSRDILPGLDPLAPTMVRHVHVPQGILARVDGATQKGQVILMNRSSRSRIAD